MVLSFIQYLSNLGLVHGISFKLQWLKMDLSIVYVSSIFLLFTQILDVDLTHGNQFNPRNKVVELTEIVKLMLEENNAKYKQVDNLSKEIQDFKSRSGYRIRKLEQELAFSRTSLSTAIDKINNMDKSGKTIPFNPIFKDKMVDLEKTRDVPKSDDNLFQNKGNLTLISLIQIKYVYLNKYCTKI